MLYAFLEVKLPISIKKKADIYVICCPPLDIWESGKDRVGGAQEYRGGC